MTDNRGTSVAIDSGAAPYLTLSVFVSVCCLN